MGISVLQCELEVITTIQFTINGWASQKFQVNCLLIQIFLDGLWVLWFLPKCHNSGDNEISRNPFWQYWILCSIAAEHVTICVLTAELDSWPNNSFWMCTFLVTAKSGWKSNSINAALQKCFVQRSSKESRWSDLPVPQRVAAGPCTNLRYLPLYEGEHCSTFLFTLLEGLKGNEIDSFCIFTDALFLKVVNRKWPDRFKLIRRLYCSK